MKRISIAAMSTLTVLVLLFGYRTSTSSRGNGTVAIGGSVPADAATTPSDEGSGSTAGAAGSTSSESNAPSPTTSSSASASSATKTVTGSAADTRWGPVQVQLTVTSGKITNVLVVEYPNNNGRDQEINATALPTLISETLSAQSAKIDMVSGATYTSQGYITSLQSALDQAGI